MTTVSVDSHTNPLLNEQMRHFHFTNKENEGYTFPPFLEKRNWSTYRLWGFSGSLGVGGCYESGFLPFLCTPSCYGCLVSGGFLSIAWEWASEDSPHSNPLTCFLVEDLWMDGWWFLGWWWWLLLVLSEPEEISGNRYEFHSAKYWGSERCKLLEGHAASEELSRAGSSTFVFNPGFIW